MSDDQRRLELGRFLRSRRLRLSPGSVGLNHTGFTRRRTKGLRREEIAALAGISLPWYTSLEQGRDINVSDQVLDSVARVLRLNQDEQDHLYSLVNPRRKEVKQSDEKPFISESMRYLLDQMPLCPAYISDEKMTVLAWNQLASSVFGSFETADERERNMVWRMFMLESYRSLFIEWESLAGSLLGEFRSMYTRNIGDPWYQVIIAELTANSPQFAAWWESYEVVCMDQHPRVMSHPQAGLLNLTPQLFPIPECKGQYLTVFTPDLRDGSVERLANLVNKADADIRLSSWLDLS